jgi:hypothetical protein
LAATSGLTRGLDGGQQERDQNADDGNDYEELDQRKGVAATSFCEAVHQGLIPV